MVIYYGDQALQPVLELLDPISRLQSLRNLAEPKSGQSQATKDVKDGSTSPCLACTRRREVKTQVLVDQTLGAIWDKVLEAYRQI